MAHTSHARVRFIVPFNWTWRLCKRVCACGTVFVYHLFYWLSSSIAPPSYRTCRIILQIFDKWEVMTGSRQCCQNERNQQLRRKKELTHIKTCRNKLQKVGLLTSSVITLKSTWEILSRVHCFRISRCCTLSTQRFTSHISSPLLTCLILLLFTLSFHSPSLLSLSRWENKEWWKAWMKCLHSCSTKYNLSGGKSSKPNVIQPRERNRSSALRCVLYCSLVFLHNWDWYRRLFQCGCTFVNMTNCEFSMEPSRLTEFRCVSVSTCECVWEKSYVMLMG